MSIADRRVGHHTGMCLETALAGLQAARQALYTGAGVNDLTPAERCLCDELVRLCGSVAFEVGMEMQGEQHDR